MTKIKERILQFIEYQGEKKESFFENLGLSYANFKGVQKKSALNSDSIDKIISKYPEINLEWLISGIGSMLKSELQPAVSSPQPQENDNNEIVSLLKDKIALLEKNNALQERENAYLLEKIKNLQEELKQHKKTAQSTMPDVLHQSTR